MAAPSKQSSRWGSFLQQAVAGVESRLDNMLAEADEAGAQKPAVTPPAVTKAQEGISRPASANSRPNDRLQERLARAVAAKNAAAQKAAEPNTPSSPPSRTSTPITRLDSPRSSIDVVSVGDADESEQAATVPPTTEATKPEGSTSVGETINKGEESAIPSVDIQPTSPTISAATESQKPINGLKLDDETPRLSTDSARSNIPRDSIDSSRNIEALPASSIEPLSTELPNNRTPAESEALITQLQSDFEKVELQRQEEIHGYIERIDALQAKLQYLSNESAESARKTVNSLPAGSLQKKLAEKDEQIALLMAEGQKLSKTEMKYLTTIKKLRAKQTEDSKELEEAKKKQEKAEHDSVILLERLRHAEANERRANEKVKVATQLQKDVDTLKLERDTQDTIIADLRKQLETAIAQEKQAEQQAAQKSLEAERKRAADLEERLANADIEKKLAADRAQAQIKELKDKMDLEAERTRVAALEMKNEQQSLEGKLELMRARAEEVSSGATGDAQAKLLRQIETLQTQYSVASENWQGIEASLIARATKLEKERDEATRREADVRKKAREVTLKAKRNEEELEDARTKLPSFQQELADHKAQMDALRQRAEQAEQALTTSKAAFEQEKEGLKSEMQQRIEEESHKIQEEMSSISHFRPESPVASTKRGLSLTSEFLGLQNIQMRRASARSSTGEIPPSILSRRPSAQPPRSSGRGTPSRQDSTLSLRTDGEIPDTPSIHTTDHDDFFERVESPLSAHHTINDMVSASTAAAGPSVQLVERMSSAVRRLESEKAATKEDLARLSAQRDEARSQIVSLMREVEAKRAADAKIAELEAEVKDIAARYGTTLEMLGEKSEQVDELKSDIDDIKAMYRELVERTVK
ncbi:hypothetical protein BP6252_09826 [Coleophoma cylindrospora]|uniref:TATA element modulatory factor 1 TATA binding domain-containing protein n=1 Tax=Coleophoma cylindrospora TaxID=1849047 RepID=A0A3D8QWW9_9HELO|nr:hypothetical protein BP6252_09826 [Coleophoma cylindrospora]